MKLFKLKYQAAFIFLIATFSVNFGCGGVVGNIEIYSFNNISKKCLLESINNCYRNKPELSKSDSSIYGVNTNDMFFFVSNIANEKYVFKVSVFTDPYGQICMSLDTGAKWGEIMKLESNLGYWEKRKIKSVFERYILPEINSEIKSSCLKFSLTFINLSVI